MWKSLADVCAKTDDALGEVHALSTMCQLPDLPLYVVSSAANRINSTLHHSGRPLPQDELGVLLRGVIDKLEERRPICRQTTVLVWHGCIGRCMMIQKQKRLRQMV